MNLKKYQSATDHPLGDKKFIKLGVSKLKNKLALFASLKTGQVLSAPKIYYLITNKCNFSCQMCPQWKIGQTENESDYLTAGQIKKIIDDAKKLGVNYFGVSGGEPLIYQNKMLKILEYANSQKFYTHFTTNGFLLDEAVIKKYEQIGGGHITLSVDAIGEKHNQLRGQKNAFSGVKKALQAFKQVNPQNIWLKINLVVTSKNLDEILKVVRLVKSINVKLFIQPYEPYNFKERQNLNQREISQKYPFWISPSQYPKLESIVNQLLQIKKQNPGLILNSKQDLILILDYFALKPRPKKCLVAYQSLVIGPSGNVDICKYGTFANLKENSLKQIWHSKKLNNIRKNSLNCNLNCLLGCYFEPTILEMLKTGLQILFSK